MGYSYKRSRSYNNYHLIFNIIIPVSVLVIVGLVLYYVVFANTLLKYSIKFYDGENLHASVKSSENEEIDMPSPPSKECRVFEGWYYDDNTFKKPFSSTDFVEFPIDKDYKVYAKWSDYKHTPAEWKIVTDSTCTSEGQKTQSCSVCDALIEDKTIEKKAHKPVVKNEKVVASTCISEGSYIEVSYCSVCDYRMADTEVSKVTPINLSAHSFDVDAKDVDNRSLNYIYPAVDGSVDSFNFEGVCKLCSKNVFDIDIPLAINYDYNCLSDGKVTYTYETCGSKFVYTNVISKGDHVLNGFPISFWSQTVNGQICYSSNLEGIMIDGDYDKACGSFSNGVFVCETCDKYEEVLVYQDHKGTWTTTQESTCDTNGKRTMKCSVCKVTVEEEMPLHEFYYTVKAEKTITTSLDSKISHKVYNLSGYCVDGLCNETHLIRNVTYKYTKAPSCLATGIVAYKPLSIPSQEMKATAALTTHYVYDESLGKNVLANNFENKDGTYDSDYSFVHRFAGESSACGSNAYGYFECVKCKELVDITVFNVHNGEWTFSASKPPHCTNYGEQIKQCLDCGETQIRVIAPLGHSYDYELVQVGGTSAKPEFNVLKSCIRDNCTEESYPLNKTNVTKAAKIKSKKEPTCSLDGVYVYTYTYTEGNVKLDLLCEVVKPAQADKHKLNSKTYASSKANKDRDGMFDINIAEIKLFAGEKILCNETKAAYFECYTCKELVSVVAYKDHSGTWTTKKEPTCYEVGIRSMDCADCGYVEEELPMLKHDYKATLEENDGNFTFKVSCGVEECTFVPTSKEVTPTSNRKIAATCSEEGRTVYTYKEKIDGIEVSASCNADFTEKAPHTVCCTKSSHKHTDDEGNYLSTVEGIVLDKSVDESSLKDGDVVDGGFLCKKCDRFIKVKVKIVK